MPIRLLRLPALAGLLLLASRALSHEFWIEPEKYQVADDEPVMAQLLNGQLFKGAKLPYFEHRTRRFEVISAAAAAPYEGRMGDLPALQLGPQPVGLLVIAHETVPDRLVYDSWEDFQAFADHKGFRGMRARHRDRGLPESGFAETYSRHAKALAAVGHGRGTDRTLGLETEFVALQNPYTDTVADGLPVRLTYQGQPRPDAQVEIFERGPDGGVAVTLTRTDPGGIARIPVKPGHAYLLDAVVLRPAAEDSDAVWESLWAALTFAVPPR